MEIASPAKWVYDFEEGSREMRALFGGKGANVAEMTRVLGPGLVPPRFVIATEARVHHPIRFFHAAGLDLVSCSPFRVPVARVATAQAALADPDPQEDPS